MPYTFQEETNYPSYIEWEGNNPVKGKVTLLQNGKRVNGKPKQ